MRDELIGLFGRRVKSQRVINAFGHGKRHPGMRAVDRTGRCVHQVLHFVVSTSFDDMQEPNQIRVDVGMRIFNRITHAGLSCEMYYAIESMRLEDALHLGAIDKINKLKGKPVVIFKLRKTGFFQIDIVIIAEIVQPYNRVSARQQRTRDVTTNKSGCSGNQILHNVYSDITVGRLRRPAQTGV